MHKNPVRGGGKTLVNTGFAAYCTTRKSTRSSRAIRAALAILSAALLFVCGLFGGLSWLPVVGKSFAPMQGRAAQTVKVVFMENGDCMDNSSGTPTFLCRIDQIGTTEVGGKTYYDLQKIPNVNIASGDTVEIALYGDVKLDKGIIPGNGIHLTIDIHHLGSLEIPENSGIGAAGAAGNITIQNCSYKGGNIYTDGGRVKIDNAQVDVKATQAHAPGGQAIYGGAQSGTAGGVTITNHAQVQAVSEVNSGRAIDGVNVIISGGARVSAYANGSSGTGIYAHNDIKIDDSDVYATGKKAALDGRVFLNGKWISVIGSVWSTAPIATPAPAPASSCATGHASYTWQTVTSADEHNDGEMVFACAGCGHVLYRVPLSAYDPFQKVTAEKIRNAAQGATVEITTSRWISFHRSVMEALAARPDVTLTISFLDGEYRGNRRIVTIPAGYDTLSLLNGTDYCGFLYLGSKFGLH